MGLTCGARAPKDWHRYATIMGKIGMFPTNGVQPSGKRLHNELERSTMLLMGESTISMAMFNSYVNVYKRVCI